MNNIKKIYKHAGNCDYQKNLKVVHDAAMVSTIEEVTDVSPSLRITPTTAKKKSAIKSLCLFTNIFYIKNKTETVVLELQNQNAEPLKLAIYCGPIKKRNGHSKINE